MQNRNLPKSPFSKEMDGFWKTEGYNYIIKIKDGELKTYEITEISCIESILAPDDYEEFIFSPFFKAKLIEGDKLMLEMDNTTFRYTAKRIRNFSEIYQNKLINKSTDPQLNFRIFWYHFKENYAFFKERNINWKKIYDLYFPKISEKTTEDQLFKIFIKMLKLFKDRHISLKTNNKIWYDDSIEPKWLNLALLNRALKSINFHQKKGERTHGKIAEYYKQVAFKDFIPLIEEKYLHNNIKQSCNGMIFWGKINQDIGYLNVLRENFYYNDLLKENHPENCIPILNNTLDEIIENFRGFKNIILDLRFNRGGDDIYALMITERFADKKRVAYAKKARDGDGFGPLWELYINPGKKKRFSAENIIVLVSGATLSGGEVFAISMNAIPNVISIGEPTMGSISDITPRNLPNGWRITLSNEIFYDKEKIPCEVVGLQPKIKKLMSLKSFKNKKDNILEEALKFLKTKNLG